MNLGNLLFTFEGRINRAKYWLTALIWFAAWAIWGAILFASDFSLAAIALGVVVIIASIISGIAVGIKRLHDREKSGWWLLLFYFAPGILDQIGRQAGDAGILFMLASTAITIWMIVELGCLRGTIGPNRYGPDPLAVTAAQAV